VCVCVCVCVVCASWVCVWICVSVCVCVCVCVWCVLPGFVCGCIICYILVNPSNIERWVLRVENRELLS
jgi:hypothetical protein